MVNISAKTARTIRHAIRQTARNGNVMRGRNVNLNRGTEHDKTLYNNEILCL